VAKIIIFDLDRTITRMGSYTPFLIYFSRTRAAWRLLFAPVVVMAMLSYTVGVVSRSRLKEIMFFFLIGTVEKKRLLGAAEEFADYIVAEKCFADAKLAIKKHLQAGDTLIMATASFSFYAQIIAERLGFHYTVGSKLVESNTHFMPKMDGENCYGQAKSDYVRTLLKKLGLSQIPDMFYSDDASDIPTLSMSKSRTLVNPDKKLLSYGDIQKNTAVVYWK